MLNETRLNRKEKRFRVKVHIMGGGLALREGQIVSEPQLGKYVEWLRREGGVEELDDQSSSEEVHRAAM